MVVRHADRSLLLLVCGLCIACQTTRIAAPRPVPGAPFLLHPPCCRRCRRLHRAACTAPRPGIPPTLPSPSFQFLLLCLKLEEMENVESVSLPGNAMYCMTVSWQTPPPPLLACLAGPHVCAASSACQQHTAMSLATLLGCR
jgi:hypothetical protein